MNYQKIYTNTITEGPGVRVALYTSGCTHHCKGCHNPEGWDFQCGTDYTSETEEQIMRELGRPFIKGLSLLGGEPYDSPDPESLLSLVRKMKMKFPYKDVWV